jgi:hypothetical protein
MAAAVLSFKLPLILVRPHRVPQVVSAVRVIGGGSAQANISGNGVVDVSPVVTTAKADTKKRKHYKPKVLARRLNFARGGIKSCEGHKLGQVCVEPLRSI